MENFRKTDVNMYPGVHMTSVFEPKTIEEYQSQIKELSSKNDTEAILRLIEENQTRHNQTPEMESFFKGEYAFYSNNYEKALVHYMQARQVEEFEFYCYRATAFVSFSRKNPDKAASFLEKALSIKPEDAPCLNLKQEMLASQEESDPSKVAKPHPQTQETEEKPTANEPESLPAMREAPEPPSDFIASKLGVDVEAEQELENRIQSHRDKIRASVRKYLENAPKPSSSLEDALYVLNGWNQPGPFDVIPHLPAKSGGYFLRWNGHGIVINPGSSFLERFHQAGLHMSMIDSVIVTEASTEAHEEIQQIYDLNYELNKMGTDLHIIRYYLNHNAHQRLAHALKPNFKQERNTVHSLELFLDSPDIEKESLSDDITLSYFSTGTRSSISGNDKAHSLAIWLELNKGAEVKRIGYISGAGWSHSLGSHFGAIDLMISGFGTTEPNDYGKLNYQDKELGYFGTYTLMEEVKPALHLVAGFDGKQGDIRLEIMKKMRKEFRKNHPSAPNAPVILPADRGMKVELNQMKVLSSINGEMLEPKKILICKTHDTFGVLSYVSLDSVL